MDQQVNKVKDSKSDSVSNKTPFPKLKQTVGVFVSSSDFYNPITLAVINAMIDNGLLKQDHTIQDVLYHVFGFDLEFGFEYDNVIHKNRFGKVVNNATRYCGYERCDEDWLLGANLCSSEMTNQYHKMLAYSNPNKW